jgi:Coproporphyrinogen III oxidase
MTDNQFNKAQEWFEDLRDQLLNIITEIDGNKFIKTSWNHKHDGGGTMSKIKGPVVEKGGVNISTVSGQFNNEMQNKIPGAKTNPSYKATGISVVLHPMSPKIPSMHFNTRFLMTTEQWFGGGMDITPALNFDKMDDYHNGFKIICEDYSPNKYYEF